MGLTPVEEAQGYVLGRVAALPVAPVAVAEARGLVLGEDVVSSVAVPPFAGSAMDGYAVVAADTAGASAAEPVRLPVVAEVAAGHPAPRALRPGEAMRIFTGAPVPDGADAIVIVEHTERLDGGAAVAIAHEAVPGAHVRGPGEDVRPGDVVFRAGDRLGPGHLGVLATIGVTEVPVHRRPRVGVLSTGDELVRGGGPLRAGQIRESNGPTLLALLAEDGFEPVDLGLVPDDEAAITAAIRRGAATCDAVLSSGGVSMGDTDLVKVVLDRLGDMTWMQIAIKPAKPFAFGLVDGTPVFGLPGNPVSSMVSYELLARPALRRLAGHPEGRWHRAPVVATAADALTRRPDGKLHLVRVVAERSADGTFAVRSAGGQGSHQLTAMARAHGLALLPDGPGAAAGDPVRVLLQREP
ncbi:MAG TPA: gephyrin-like molybdotransferase Glp [Acidimicrobiales bacterium]|nr:gephyrin-like molybdotransferase Glp [Acidimicrobiales bacterium]